ncbi:MAG: enoyl-CoA hydratase [Myxococcota bacterium]|nr:enoyl-CoA hydratase [Myxococcota bacterium]
MYEQLLYDVEDPIATITLNRPERLNAFTNRMGDELKHAIATAEEDPSVVAILLTGAGRGFCAGADLKGLEAIGEGRGMDTGDGAPSQSLDASPGDPSMGDSFQGPYSYMLSVRKPIIAAINGPIAGLGFAIALFADMRFASDRAKFTTAFSQRGLIAEWGIGWTLPRLVGTAHALDLLMSGRKFDAAEAERIGLVNRTLPHDELLPFVRQYARDLAANASPASMAIMKRQVYSRLTSELGPAMDESIRLMQESFDRPDFKEGVRSFLDGRKPKFERV